MNKNDLTSPFKNSMISRLSTYPGAKYDSQCEKVWPQIQGSINRLANRKQKLARVAEIKTSDHFTMALNERR